MVTKPNARQMHMRTFRNLSVKLNAQIPLNMQESLQIFLGKFIFLSLQNLQPNAILITRASQVSSLKFWSRVPVGLFFFKKKCFCTACHYDLFVCEKGTNDLYVVDED